jgi:neutral ceramidase
MRRNLIWAALLLAGLLIVFVVSTITTVVDEPLEQTEYYQSTMQRLDGYTPATTGDTVKVGWAKVNLAPPYPTPIAIDAHRKGVFEKVLDSIYVRAFVFDNGTERAAYVTLDMLIFPPSVTAVLNDSLAGTGYSLDNTFLTATHTHSSFGAWAPGIIGEIFAGKYDPAIVAHIAHCVAMAIRNASIDMDKAKIGFNRMDCSELVYNRLLNDSTNIDPWFRYIRITRDDGKNAIIANFSAHATYLHDTIMKLHRDYPGHVVDYLESMITIDFAAFGAGAMGSMGPVYQEKGPWLGIEQTAADLFYKVMQSWNNTPLNYITKLNTMHLPIDLGEQQVRLNNYVRIRPWVANWVFGENPHFISGLRLGNTVLIGTPCDFSGELVAELTKFAEEKSLNLMVHSFNGDFIGYITHDNHYHLNAYETRTMNWFGPHNGRYFQEIIKKMIDHL